MTSQLAVLKPSSLTDWLLEHGRHFVTTPEIAELLGVSATSVPVTLHRARTANKIVSVTKGPGCQYLLLTDPLARRHPFSSSTS